MFNHCEMIDRDGQNYRCKGICVAIKQVKLQVNELTVGMFVSGLDRPWSQTPFPLQGFYIRDLDEIKELKVHCSFVYIDVQKGTAPLKNTLRKLSSSRASVSSRKPDRNARRAPMPDVAPLKIRRNTYTTIAPLEKEMGKAKELHQQVYHAVGAVMEQVNQDHSNFPVREAKRVAGHMVDSVIRLKPTGIAPGDVTDKQLEIIADLADKYSFGELRATHEQNIVLADVKVSELFNLWQEAKAAGFATANIGTLTDIICCPGGDFCSLANAKSIPIAEAIQREFDDLDYLYDLGDLDLNISGCMNACGHHHIGHIGILGVDKKGAEFYQVQLGGNAGNNAALAKVLGPAFSAEDMPTVVRKLVDVFVEKRVEGEQFFETYNRVGIEPFKERIYAKAS